MQKKQNSAFRWIPHFRRRTSRENIRILPDDEGERQNDLTRLKIPDKYKKTQSADKANSYRDYSAQYRNTQGFVSSPLTVFMPLIAGAKAIYCDFAAVNIYLIAINNIKIFKGVSKNKLKNFFFSSHR